MAEYIEREKLRQAFLTDLQSLSSWDVSLFKLLMIEIDEAPSADVAPVRHGHWDEIVTHNGCTPDYDCLCSVCKKSGMPTYYYCPHCGAKVDEEENEGESIANEDLLNLALKKLNMTIRELESEYRREHNYELRNDS